MLAPNELSTIIHNAQLSAYLVGVKSTRIIVLAENISNACDKLASAGFTDYEFVHSNSFDVIA
jgi:hypothetical protein